MTLSNYGKNLIQKEILDLVAKKQKQLVIVKEIQKKFQQEQAHLTMLNKKIQLLKADIL